MPKIAIINKCGNIGKTTIKEILQILYPHYETISVETTNKQDEDTGNFIKGSQFALLQNALLTKDNLIIDIGGSNYEKFIAGLISFDGSIHDFDYFIVPTTPDPKTQTQSLETTIFLNQQGINKEKILVLFNRVPINDQDESVADNLKNTFPIIFASDSTGFTKKAFGIKENDFFKLRNAYQYPWEKLDELNADESIKQLKKEKDEVKKKELAKIIALARLWGGVKKEIKPLTEIINVIEK